VTGAAVDEAVRYSTVDMIFVGALGGNEFGREGGGEYREEHQSGGNVCGPRKRPTMPAE
jgi:hypothetical protein